MTLILSGTDGLSDIDGSAATPAIRGTDTNTGIFFPAADTIAFAEGGTEVARFDSSGNFGIGTSSPLASAMLEVSRSTTVIPTATVTADAQVVGWRSRRTGGTYPREYYIGIRENSTDLDFYDNTANALRARIDSSGNLLVGATATNPSSGIVLGSSSLGAGNGITCATTLTTNAYAASFKNGNGYVGAIITNGSSTAYNTSSDYRLKHDIAPMQNALATVAQLKPVTYKWNADDSESQGFIAHELQAVVPDCVTGEKDAVDADGNPVYQGIDTSFLVATLTAAIQEQQQMIETLQAKVAALEQA